MNLLKLILTIITLSTLFVEQSRAQAKHYTDDLHIHLNGSYSLNFLKSTALKNDVWDQYQEFLGLHDKMQKYIAQNNFDEIIPIIWQKFALIHHIVQSLDDVKEGTTNLVIEHPSSYLEIRTTPKNILGKTREEYVQAFVEGLKEGNKHVKGTKAVGILSIDRVQHTLCEAIEIINLANKYHSLGEPIVGIDISGNPYAKNRSISAENLKQVLELALEMPLGVAIHFAESNNDLEKSDSDIVLNTLENWKNNKLGNKNETDKEFFFGKVRLGHVIFPTKSQIKTIKKLNLPIEICPTCHKLIGWWKNDQIHPIKSIYENIDDPVIIGTDDTIIFNNDIITEQNHINNIYNLDNSYLINSQKFRFHNSSKI